MANLGRSAMSCTDGTVRVYDSLNKSCQNTYSCRSVTLQQKEIEGVSKCSASDGLWTIAKWSVAKTRSRSRSKGSIQPQMIISSVTDMSK